MIFLILFLILKMHLDQVRLKVVLARIQDAYAFNTIRAYRADFEEFIRFCHLTGDVALPSTPQVLANFVDSVATSGQSAASIRRKIASISAIHRWSRNGDPTKDPDVRLSIRKMHRKLGRSMKQAHGINEAILNRMLTCTGLSMRGLRDRALLMVAYDTLRRRSELVSLRVTDIHRTATGASILLRHGKTDQEGVGTWLQVSAATLKSIDAWLNTSEVVDGCLFRGVRKNQALTRGLCAGQVGRIFKRLARSADLPASIVERISGHSLRVGAAQDLLVSGATLPQIMVKGGWTKVDTVIRYVEKFGGHFH
jgi:site-specific recombinase XerD